MFELLLKNLTTPGAYAPRRVRIAGLLAMSLIFMFDVMTGAEIRIHALYLFPLAAIALHCERRLDSVIGIVASLAFQIHNSVVHGSSPVAMKADAVIFMGSSLLVVYLARAVRENYVEKSRHADTDWLTRLHNRRSFETLLGTEITRQQRYGGVFSLAIIDLDDFKRLNDSKGHLAGDKALMLLADVLRENTRESDSLARVGGDEFAVMLPNTGREDCEKLCQQLARNIAIRMAEADFGIGASVGCSTFERAPASTSAALQEADKSMYAAKSGTKGRPENQPPR